MITLTLFSNVLPTYNGTDIKDLTVRKIGSDTNLYGYAKSKYTLGEENEFDVVDTIGLKLDLNQTVLKGVSFGKESKFELSNGIKYGSPKDEIEEKIGKPIHDEIKLNKGQTVVGSIDALVYENLLITFDENKRASNIFFGAF